MTKKSHLNPYMPRVNKAGRHLLQITNPNMVSWHHDLTAYKIKMYRARLMTRLFQSGDTNTGNHKHQGHIEKPYCYKMNFGKPDIRNWDSDIYNAMIQWYDNSTINPKLNRTNKYKIQYVKSRTFNMYTKCIKQFKRQQWKRLKKKRRLLRKSKLRLLRTWYMRNKNRDWFNTEKHVKRFGIVHIRKTKNNLHMNISNLIGTRQVKWHASCGTVIRKNGRRKKRKAQLRLFKHMKYQLSRLGIRYLILEIFGLNRPLNVKFVNHTIRKPYKILALKHCISLPHNGCRPPKPWKV